MMQASPYFNTKITIFNTTFIMFQGRQGRPTQAPRGFSAFHANDESEKRPECVSKWVQESQKMGQNGV